MSILFKWLVIYLLIFLFVAGCSAAFAPKKGDGSFRVEICFKVDANEYVN